MVTTYSSKQDWWIVGLVRLSIAAMLVAVVGIWLSPAPLLTRLALCGWILAIAGFSLHVMHTTAYDLTEEDLIVRAGIMRRRVPIDAILSVKPSRCLLSGPALSLDRLHVRYHGSRWGVLISPDDRQTFLADLAGRSSELELLDGTLVRRDESAGQAN
jgi:hypothetical protein